jgi:UDP-N-acetylmuramoyl-tripeptide--D-alanyl-D-alanine ligase
VDIAGIYKIFIQHPSIQTDTRKLKEGDIFWALKGPYFNGNEFAKTALENNAAYAVVDEEKFVEDERIILVEDGLKALQELALFHRRQFNIPFIAITGSNGKTTTKELVTCVLAQQFKTYATKGNFNNHIGVPLTILSVPLDAEIAVIEMGANHQKEIESYCKIALPTHGIITNVGKAHIEGFGSVEGIRKGKGELYDFLKVHKGVVFRNADLPYLHEMANGISSQITYGLSDANITGSPSENNLYLDVNFPEKNITIHSQLVGNYNFPNIMTAVTVGLHFGVDILSIKKAIENYSPDNSRSQLLKINSNTVVLDAYNANPTSMRAAISNFNNLSLENKMLWIGAMKEIGNEEAIEHDSLVKFIAENDWREVVLVGNEFKVCKGKYQWFENSDEASAFVKKSCLENCSILIKGSRGSKMEKMLEALR